MARAAETYRGRMHNMGRSTRAQQLKQDRLSRGETKSQADRRRWLEAQAAARELLYPAPKQGEKS